MKKIIIVLLLAVIIKGISAQGIYNNGAHIVSTTGSYWVVDNGDFTLNSTSATQLAQMDNLIVSEDASLTLTENSCLTVSGNLTTTGGTLNVNSDASNNGSLIVEGSSTGNITYNRYVTGIDKWHLISSPVGGQNINDFVVTHAATNAVAAIDPKYGLAPYYNSTPGWAYYTTSTIGSAGDFVAGKGYEVLRTADGTVSFTGTLATDDVDIAISKNTSGWNLVGNPFPAAVNAANVGTNFLAVNASAIDDEYEAVYVWDAANSVFITVNNTSGATYIAPGQAFFVYSVEGGSSVDFTEAMQTHQPGTIFKSGEIEPPSIKLIAERAKGTSTTKIMYFENTTTGLDPGYDAGRFSGGDNSFAIYTHLVGDETNTIDFDIQCLTEGDYSLVIPVGLNAPANTELVFRAEAAGLPASVPVNLEDRLTGIFTDLSELGSSYKILLADKSAGTGRFYLHTQKSAVTAVNPDLEGGGFEIMPHPQDGKLRIFGNTGVGAEISVYNMLGQKLISRKLENSSINEVEMEDLKTGAYIVFIHSSTQKVSKKISWIQN